ncbi:hypothetical protein L596_020512 [Steinernema carpocapsae]|nr:hypothetical protein L596_020512 [Steinernema carpocapsae]
MEVYFFKSAVYDHYYNCFVKSEQEWAEVGLKRPILGTVNIVIGTIVMAILIPCMKTMLEPKLWRNSCYKLMFFNAVIDFMGVINSSYVTSVLAIQGAVYCTYPTFIYIYGSVGVSLWFSQCLGVMLLGLNRLADFSHNNFLMGLFEGKNIYVLFVFPVISFTFSLFYARPALYSSIANMWNSNPYFAIQTLRLRSLS